MREADPDMVEHRERLARRAARGVEKNVTKSRKVAVAVPGTAVPAADPEKLGLVAADRLEAGPRSQRAKQTRSQRKK
jgi:preprotein translocase subunit SecF